ncbi:hypothetical protein [Cerasicoccus arenae]|uniref:Uncharacterized protein n=1 Tax=Cerasicoccus arenae TaxID=424488 RepID=A0A8J3DJY9_9BACT|nr:hypothetical protein [Cerasicoccus arenae]MBK1860020.1 hypothetical protein [Cerasicoccus arenae]GHC12598.1 hypothetical protein GCM10007047_32460 [Cerasicoccus arenae]
MRRANTDGENDKSSPRGIRIRKNDWKRIDALANQLHTNANGVFQMLADALFEYAEENPDIATPVKIVSKRDYEQFAAVLPKLELRLREEANLPPRQEAQPSVDHSIYERPKRKTARKKASGE